MPVERPTRKPAALWSNGTTTRPVFGQKRNAWWSDSASDQPWPSGALVQQLRAAEVGDVEDRDLRAEPMARVVGVLADAEHQVLADRVQVRGVAGDLQLAEHARLLRVGEVDRVERVDLAERDDVAGVADEAHRVDALALAEPADAADLGERRRPLSRSVVRYDSESPPSPHHAGVSVLTTRSTPPNSDSDHWLSR